MFTGLVEEMGRLAERREAEQGARLRIDAPGISGELALGDSVAVNGACLTVVASDAAGFEVDCVAETLRRTALGGLAVGDPVNLERALLAGARLGGHIVQGHIDGTGTVTAARGEGESTILTVAAPPEIMRYVVEKGSITLEGVSLTVAARTADDFDIALIPHTMELTTLGPGLNGRTVNLEVDLVAKYVETLVTPYLPEPPA